MISRHVLTIPSSGGRRVHYRTCGSGPALLMVHQSPRNSGEYAALMEDWGTHFTCIAPDTPGFGQSDPLPGDPEIGDFADALIELLAALGIERPAAYGFHSGGVILAAALKRHPRLFSCLAIGGYAVWSDDEMNMFGERYLPEFRPTDYGEHLTWLWNRMLEQNWFFPWFDVNDRARLSDANVDLAYVQRGVMEMLDAGNAYRSGYGAVLRAPRDLPSPDAAISPVLITAYKSDPLEAHIVRMGPMPSNWSARSVATPAEHHEQSLAFLQGNTEGPDCPLLAEDDSEGWVYAGDGLIHWRGALGAERMLLHHPGHELSTPAAGEIAIDLPGHGLSDDAENILSAIERAAQILSVKAVVLPNLPLGELDSLYPDLTPDRFGAHLLRAWGIARAEALFRPWYAEDDDHAIRVEAAALHPDQIAIRTRARLRAGVAAARWHATVADKKSWLACDRGNKWQVVMDKPDGTPNWNFGF